MNDGVLRVQGCREFHELARRDELNRRARSAFSAGQEPSVGKPGLVPGWSAIWVPSPQQSGGGCGVHPGGGGGHSSATRSSGMSS